MKTINVHINSITVGDTILHNNVISTVCKNNIKYNEFNASIVSETKDLGTNLFGLFHAVTHYTTHKVKGENVFGNLFGTVYNMNEKASQFVAELV
jgi:hypothetical protein